MKRDMEKTPTAVSTPHLQNKGKKEEDHELELN